MRLMQLVQTMPVEEQMRLHKELGQVKYPRQVSHTHSPRPFVKIPLDPIDHSRLLPSSYSDSTRGGGRFSSKKTVSSLGMSLLK